MSSTAPVLEVIYRVEPGCLGPQGKDYIEDFCNFSQPLVTAHTAGFMRWILVPRFDKSLPEMQCTLAGRTLTPDQAKRYFALFQVDADDLEAELNEQLTLLIDQYFGRW
ncbi:hypothetical protein [Rheinheimera sp.]|uniref:hypothetical protein n=1 Tax=Rheinheimera sp. TaxID=1869214 RepID=UPI0027BA1664|nr:hypothetical protein [Rheinheimera sp.]